MKKTRRKTWISAAIAIAWLSACSTAPQRTQETPAATAPIAAPRAQEGLKLKPADLAQAISSVEIAYAIGHEQRHLFALQASEGGVEASSYVGNELLRGGPINRDRYVRFLSAAQEFMRAHGKREPASTTPPPSDCGSSYTIRIHGPEGSWTLHGCRSQEHELGASVSRLIHEGELLVFTRN